MNYWSELLEMRSDYDTDALMTMTGLAVIESKKADDPEEIPFDNAVDDFLLVA